MKMIIYLLDWLLLNIIYLSVHYGLTGTLSLPPSHIKLLLLMHGVWLLLAIIDHKFSGRQIHSFRDILLKLGRITLLMLFLTTFILLLLDLRDFHRQYILYTFVLLYLCEIAVAILFRRRIRLDIKKNGLSGRAPQRLSFTLLSADLLVFLLLFLLVHYYKYHTFIFQEREWQLLFIMLGVWWLSAHWTGKFLHRQHLNFFYAYEPFIKAAFITASAAALLVYTFELFNFSRTILFAPVLLLLIIELPMALAWLGKRGGASQPQDVEDAAQVAHIMQLESMAA
ncbi:hypothetical protein JXO59_07145, partial [candidate division KSB1 bacterium]|nr:hypothetical protein [candidate division KSB1 bacterium]